MSTIEHDRAQVRFYAEADALMAQRHGNDLNPFTTQGARGLWQAGWDGKPLPQPNAEGSTNWRYWERGRQAKIIATTTAKAP